MTPDRAGLVALAQKLLDGDYDSDVELDDDMAAFKAAVPHPRASDLLYYWQDEFDHEPTAEEVVERALTYRAIEL